VFFAGRDTFIHLMDIAIVTGAETPLGLRIIEGLIQQGCRVHGIGNNLSRITFADRNFIAHAVDVSDLSVVQQTTTHILEKEARLDILIHAIDVTPGAAFEKLPVGNLEAILKIGLLGPVMLTRLALPNLLRFRGQLINIIPANKSGSAPSAVNSLIEGGLREMNNALFDQARDAGLRVTNLILRQNTAFPAASVNDEQLDQTRIDPEQVARTIDYLLNANESNVPNEITLYPRLSAESTAALPKSPLPIDPYNAIVLPPAEYAPPEEPKIPTRQADRIERTIPYTDEEMEDKVAAAIEDFDEHPERYEPKEKQQRSPQRPSPKQTPNVNQGQNESNRDDDHANSKPRRGRRRSGRNRNRERETNDSPHENDSTPATLSDSAPTQTLDGGNKPNRNRRRGGKRKPEHANDGQITSESPKQNPEVGVKTAAKTTTQPITETHTPRPKVHSEPKPKKADQPKLTEKPAPATKPTKKTAAKKVIAKKIPTKKTAVEKAATKTVVKKVAKKTATKKVPAKKAVKRAAKKRTVKKAE